MRWLLVGLVLAGCAHSGTGTATVTAAATATATTEKGAKFVQSGKASWYGKEQQGGPTASGERFDMRKLTCAHRSLRFGTIVEVTNLKNGLTVSVRVNDRGPFSRGRIIDLSWAAAKQIGMIDAGVVPVRIVVR